jgi:hypothetical protein
VERVAASHVIKVEIEPSGEIPQSIGGCNPPCGALEPFLVKAVRFDG